MMTTALERQKQQRQIISKTLFTFICLLVLFCFANVNANANEPSETATINLQSSAINRTVATGFFITDSGHLITAHHVVKNATSIQVLIDRQRVLPAIILKGSEELDLALLQVQAITPFVYLSHSKGVPAGMDVVTIGYPQVSIQGITPKITRGIVNSSTGLRDAKTAFQFSAEVQKGNSGGPLIGPGGTIVGIVQSKLDALKLSETTDDLTQNVNFATKSAVLLEFVKDVPNLPTTRPLQPEQPLNAIRIYQELWPSIVPIIATND